ncbi:OLC1v1010714C1 [Oldenlandia corymbosa var. corymbosa]|uniref:non-specific serine/threonine protein kinase n=1 Tax=Oldenlandia corymbosa var. corymbosa TaxID=529605 RepID=A0AAV1DS04_OLDCO|nr:OLC1v1010714C1 [Oldenlandia corymbosa var. corymbosa]
MKSRFPFLLHNSLYFILIFFSQFPFVFTDDNRTEWFTNCTNLFSCGGINTGDFPFWGGNRPRECGHPGMKLDCDNDTPVIEIMSVKYRVLEINPDSQILRIIRQDFGPTDLCPDKFINTTLDYNIFEYSPGYLNVTVQYGCPLLYIQIPSMLTCTVNGTTYQNGYVVPGAQGPGSCQASVFFPIRSTSFGVMQEMPNIGQLIDRGFELRWKLDGTGCKECKNSRGSCGYDLKSGQFTCLCPSGESSGSSECSRSNVSISGGDQYRSESLSTLNSDFVSSSPELYQKCPNSFSCGDITEIGYPFRVKDDPEYCGYPGLELRCYQSKNDGPVTRIEINNMAYRVLDINPQSQIMRIAREDVMEANCPTELVNTTLDYALFDYATPANYTNLTFLYGCPMSNLGLNPFTPCGNNGAGSVYVLPAGTVGPARCNSSVIYPVAQTGDGGSFNYTGLDQILRRGFDVRWKVDSRICGECSASNGKCGYNFVTNQTNCYCPNPPNVEAVACSVSSTSPSSRGNPTILTL